MVNRSWNHNVLTYTANRSWNPDIMIFRDALIRSPNFGVMIYMNTLGNLDFMVYKDTINRHRIRMS